ncbi:MAG: TetR/AcrR family transcriptional regulator [Deltaproteobacteria bacterium]|nr:TetR/AcrR family transcriptional regulator [Deltaproteobacteria bacterium]
MPALTKRIRAAATDLVEAGGHEGLSMRALGQAVGISPMAIYRHFEDREDLLDAVAEAGFHRLEAALWRIDRSAPPRARVLALLDAYLEFSLEHPHLFELMFLTHRKGIRRFPEDFREGRSRAFHELREDVATCMRTGVFRADDPLETTLSLWAHAHGLVSLNRVGRFEDEAGFRAIYGRALLRFTRGLEGYSPL